MTKTASRMSQSRIKKPEAGIIRLAGPCAHSSTPHVYKIVVMITTNCMLIVLVPSLTGAAYQDLCMVASEAVS